MPDELKPPERIWYEPTTEFAWPYKPDEPESGQGLPIFEYTRTAPSQADILEYIEGSPFVVRDAITEFCYRYALLTEDGR